MFRKYYWTADKWADCCKTFQVWGKYFHCKINEILDKLGLMVKLACFPTSVILATRGIVSLVLLSSFLNTTDARVSLLTWCITKCFRQIYEKIKRRFGLIEIKDKRSHSYTQFHLAKAWFWTLVLLYRVFCKEIHLF